MVVLLDSTNVNHALIKDGWCWWYWKYTPENTVLESLENEARKGCGLISGSCYCGSGDRVASEVSKQLCRWEENKLVPGSSLWS